MSRKFTKHYPDAKGAFLEEPGLGIVLAAKAGAPSAAATGFAKGSLYLDTTNGNLYQNTGTATSATWTPRGLGAQGAALTTQLTTLTHTAPGTPDFAIQDFGDAVTGQFAFESKDEANTVLSVIANLQTRMAEVEAVLEAAGLVAAN